MIYPFYPLHSLNGNRRAVQFFVGRNGFDKTSPHVSHAAAMLHILQHMIPTELVTNEISTPAIQELCGVCTFPRGLVIEDNDAPVIDLAVAVDPHPRFTCRLPAVLVQHLYHGFVCMNDLAQKKLLIHCSMLNNAIVMENLASADGDGTNPPERGAYMRRYTDVDLVDSITYLPANEVPYTYNDDDIEAGRYYWGDFRPDKGDKGIYLVMDSTLSMMLHFTQEHMAKQLITNDDFAKFMGRPRQTRDVHIYDALLQQQDLVAQNGYVNMTEKVIKPLPNMAELIRTNGRTKIFSHMLDRFSFPYPNAAVTEDYKKLHPDFNGTIYTKKYFALRGAGGRSQKVGPDGKTFSDGSDINLQYDPGWNEFYFEEDGRVDMAAMFVPNDDALMEYFSEGGAGWQLVQTYAPDPWAEVPAGDFDALYRKIDWIPLSTLDKLLNVIMFSSFNSSVPSKITDLRDYQSQEEMFSPDDLNEIDTCMLACNGAVYVMDKVYSRDIFKRD